MDSAPIKWGDWVLFSYGANSVADRPDIMTARSLSLAVVGDADLSFLRANQSLRVLQLSEADALRGLEDLSQVRELVLSHSPKVHSLEPLAALRDLRFLTITTPPSWDASRKCLEVDSLEPLGGMHALVSLDLCGVRPIHGGLQPLRKLTGLQVLSVSHVYDFDLRDYADLAAHLPSTAGNCLRPCYGFGVDLPCRKCGRQMVGLTGSKPRARRSLCLSCDKARLIEHFEAWKEAAGRDFPYPASAQDVAPESHVHYTGV